VNEIVEEGSSADRRLFISHKVGQEHVRVRRRLDVLTQRRRELIERIVASGPNECFVEDDKVAVCPSRVGKKFGGKILPGHMQFYEK
jgi:FixJ family two-component response regulator